MTSSMITAPAAPKTFKFGGSDNNLFHVEPLCSQEDAIATSVVLTEGLEMLCSRMATSTNYNDDPVTIAELRTLGVVAGAINSLLKTVRSKLESEQGGAA